MSEQLKPCPFCGSSEIEVNPVGLHTYFQACCTDCVSSGSSFDSREEAAAQWNTRTTTDAGERADADELKRLKLFRTMMESAATNVTTPMFVKAVVDSADEAIELLMSRGAERASGGAG